jgi:dTDP-4-dehydrorhamnose reductase
MTKILVFGKTGQLSQAFLTTLLQETKFHTTSYSRVEVDFNNINNLVNFLDNLIYIPEFILNCIAYTNVDQAEQEQEICNNINHLAVAILADFCQKNKIRLIHYSTDYVFDGSGNLPFLEDNTINLKPLNFYGKTKLWAEEKIIQSGCSYLIFRISWLYNHNPNSKNFVNTIIKLSQQKQTISVVNDQIGSPTDVDFIVKNSIKSFYIPSGIYHLNNGIYMSWYSFACQIFEKIKTTNQNIILTKILGVDSSQYSTKAIRPKNSQLDNSKIKKFILLD